MNNDMPEKKIVQKKRKMRAARRKKNTTPTVEIHDNLVNDKNVEIHDNLVNDRIDLVRDLNRDILNRINTAGIEMKMINESMNEKPETNTALHVDHDKNAKTYNDIEKQKAHAKYLEKKLKKEITELRSSFCFVKRARDKLFVVLVVCGIFIAWNIYKVIQCMC